MTSYNELTIIPNVKPNMIIKEVTKNESILYSLSLTICLQIFIEIEFPNSKYHKN